MAGPGWAVARRLDWPTAARPYFLFNAQHLHLRDSGGTTYGPIWFQTQASAQRRADELNAKG